MIEKRISVLSYDETELNKVNKIYQDALASSGHPSTITYQSPTTVKGATDTEKSPGTALHIMQISLFHWVKSSSS